ncbi:YitT family protein [Niallia taxi]|uniref:YitT family protein n=2 Tax=Niallia taxi TaxID=2499688 RepID=A0A3S3SK04_9BACI|nr:YitT family protein [Niallia taxi]MDE5054197.1 YitT family protein [Niallia taxi]MED3961159.1 YitT family protein [Niallia taxi]RVT62426.1 YitT family protein [Niallia taxi]WOD64992.1 YitT family protein [Niallia taxi]
MQSKQEFRSYSLIILGTFLVGLAFNIFLLPASITAGGVAGISIILNKLNGWSPAVVQWAINIPTFVLGYFLLGKDFSIRTFVGTTLLPTFIWLTSYLPFSVEDPLLASIYGGILSGIGIGLVFRGKGSTGGTTIFGQLIKKYTRLSSGYSQFLIDGCIVIVAMFVFDFERALYGMIAMFIIGKSIDVVQLRSSTSKLVLIVTENEQKITDLIRNEIDRGFTKVWSEGGYSNQKKALLFSVVEQSEAVYLKELIQRSDNSSFVIFLNASDIIGRGFSLPRDFPRS